jgi:hypothetical protein
MGNGIDPVATSEFEVAPGFAPALPGTAGLEDPPAGLLPDAPPDVAPDVLADAPHPASAITAAPARTARADLYLSTP